MADVTGQYWDSKLGAVPTKYVDQGDGTWALRVVNTGAGGGGGGGGVAQTQVREAGGTWADVGVRVADQRMPVEVYVGTAAIDPRSIRTLTSTDVVTAQGKGVVSTNNSSTAVLGIGGVFTGTADDVRDFSSVVVSFISDQGAAFNGIQLQWSSDNVNWDVVDSYNMDFLGVGKTLVSAVRGRYFRVVYTNGGTAQGYFRLATVLKYSTEVFTVEAYMLGAAGKRGEVQAYGDGIGAQNRVLTDALLRAQRTDTGNQDVVRMTPNQNLKVEIAVGAALIDPRSIRTLTSADVVDVSDRAARLIGDMHTSAKGTSTAGFPTSEDLNANQRALDVVIFGSGGAYIQQTAVNFNTKVEVAVGGTLIDPRSIRTLTTADAINVGQWIGSAAPTVGSKTSANSLPVVIASDQGAIPDVRQATAANLNVRTDTSGATAAAVPARADYFGGIAKTAMPTATADGQLTGALMDQYGRLTTFNAPESLWGQGRVTLTTVTSTAALAAAGAGVKWAITDILVTCNIGTAATRVDILDGATLIHSFAFVQTAITAGEPRSFTYQFRMPYKGTANTAVNVQLGTAVTDVRVVITGFKTIL